MSKVTNKKVRFESMGFWSVNCGEEKTRKTVGTEKGEEKGKRW